MAQAHASAENREIKLITREALEQIQMAKQLNLNKKVNIPTVTFLINNIVLFTFHGVQLMLVAFENRKVKMFDASNGHFQYEFTFLDNSLDGRGGQAALQDSDSKKDRDMDADLEARGRSASPDHASKKSPRQKSGGPRNEDDVLGDMVKGERAKQTKKNRIKGMNQSKIARKELTPLEAAYMKRKEQRDKGIYKPQPLPMTGWYKAQEVLNKKKAEVGFRKMISTFTTPAAANIQTNVQEQLQELKSETNEEVEEIDAHTLAVNAYQSSGFAGTVQLNTNDKIPVELFGDFWNSVENTAEYSNKFLTEKEEKKQQDAIDFKEKVKQRATSKKPTVRQMMNSQNRAAARKPFTLQQVMKKNTSGYQSQNSTFLNRRATLNKVATTESDDFKQEERLNSRLSKQNQESAHQSTQQLQQLPRISRGSTAKALTQSSTRLAIIEKQKELQKAINKKRAVSSGKSYYQLGVDNLTPDSLVQTKQDMKISNTDNQYGLPDEIFTYKKDPNQKRYRGELWKMVKDDLEKKEKQISNKDRLKKIKDEVNHLKRQAGPLADGNLLKDIMGIHEEKQAIQLTPAEKQALIASIMAKKRLVEDMIEVLAQKQEFLGKMVADFEETQQRKLNITTDGCHDNVYDDENGKRFDYRVNLNRNKVNPNDLMSDQDRNLKDLKEMYAWTAEYMFKLEQQARNLKQQEQERQEGSKKMRNKSAILRKPNVPEEMKVVKADLFRKIQRQRQLENPNQDDKKAQKKAEEDRKVYPMKMEFYEEENIAVFALVSKEIQIQRLKKTGAHRKFTCLQTLRVEFMITDILVQKHSSGNLLIVVATQGKNNARRNKEQGQSSGNKCEINAYVLDPSLEFEVIQAWRWQWDEEQVTSMCYDTDCALILTSFSGCIELYDPETLNMSIWDNRYTFKVKRHQTYPTSPSGPISCVTYSKALSTMAYAGVSGTIYLLDKRTKLNSGQVDAAQEEIVMLRYVDSQLQLICLTKSSGLSIWDAQRLHCIQLLKNSFMSQKSLCSWYYYPPAGRVLLATSKIYKFDMITDADVVIKTRQQNFISRDYLRQYKQKMIEEGQLSLEGTETAIKPGQMTEKQFLQTAFDDNAIKDYIPPSHEYNGSVLPSPLSKLVGCFVDEDRFLCYTVDSDYMVRCWHLDTGRCKKSYMIEIRDEFKENPANLPKIILVRGDPTYDYLVIGFEEGFLQINDMHTGDLIYNSNAVDPIKLDSEISHISFFGPQSKYWMVISCWESRVCFISRPQENQGRKFLNYKSCKSHHARDVVGTHINFESQIVSASNDNILSFWNSFSATESKQIQLPPTLANMQESKSVHFVRYPFNHMKDLVMIVMSQGEIYMVDTQAEEFLTFQVLDNYIHEDSDDSVEDSAKMKHVMGRVCPSSIIDYDDGYMVTLKESGEGQLHKLTYEDSADGTLVSRCSEYPVSLFYQGSFSADTEDINENYGNWAGNFVFGCQLCLKHNIFIAYQNRGQVSIFSIDTCQRMAVLNQGIVPSMKLKNQNAVSQKVVPLSNSVWPQDLAKSVDRLRVKSHQGRRASQKHRTPGKPDLNASAITGKNMLNQDSALDLRDSSIGRQLDAEIESIEGVNVTKGNIDQSYTDARVGATTKASMNASTHYGKSNGDPNKSHMRILSRTEME